MDTLKNEVIGYHVRAAKRWKSFTPGQKKTMLLAIPLAILLLDAVLYLGAYAGFNALYWVGASDQYIPAGDMPYISLLPGLFLFQFIVSAAHVVFIIRYSRNTNNAPRDE